MKYTFEISISGCATDCGHCYVNGGPGPQMKRDDAIYCTDRIAAAFEGIEGERYITFGNENFCHPHVAEIFSHIHRAYPEYFTERETVPTTGIALAKRPDRESVFRAMKDCGVERFEMTLHGAGAVHDGVVRRSGAFEALFEAARIMEARGFGLFFNLMVSRTLAECFEDVAAGISRFHGAEIRLTVPLYVPTRRMRAYQENRADAEMCLRIAYAAEKAGIDASALRKCADSFSRRDVEKLIRSGGFDYAREKANMPDWKFFNVDRNLDVFYGNVGMHTHFLGNLRRMSDGELRSCLIKAESNYDYTAFYPDGAFQNLERVAEDLPTDGRNLVYPSLADCIYAMLDEAGVKHVLI